MAAITLFVTPAAEPGSSCLLITPGAEKAGSRIKSGMTAE